MKSGYLRSFASYSGGIAVSQALALGALPVLTRLYSPKDIGLVAALVSFGAIVLPLATLRFDMAVILPKKEDEALQIIKTGISSIVVVSTAALVVSLVAVHYGDSELTANAPDWAGPSIAAFILVNGILAFVTAYFARRGEFLLMAKTSVMSSFFSNAAKIGVGGMGLGVGGLWLATISQGVLGVLLFLRKFPIRHFLKIQKTSSTVMKRYREFPLYRMPQDVLNALTVNLPNVVVISAYGADQAGFYALAFKVASAPIDLLKNSLRTVFYKHSSDLADNPKQILREVIRLTVWIAISGVLLAGIAFFTGEKIFVLLFGEEWRIAGMYSFWIAIWLACSFANAPSVSVIPLIPWNKEFLLFEVVSTLIRLTLVFYVCYNFRITVAIPVISLIAAATNVSLVILVIRRLIIKSK
jgi:O-antigen/teichoic acid export membrane protein